MAIHHTYIYTYVSTYKHTQESTTHPKVTKQLNQTLSRPAPHSGWGVSLRRIPLRLGEGPNRNKKASRDHAQARPLSPRRVVCSLKTHSGRLGDHSRIKLWASLCTSRLGESISVRHCSHLHNAYPHPTEISKQFKSLRAIHKLKQTTNHTIQDKVHHTKTV